jgi:ATP-binding cassette subfamily B protein
VVVVLAALTTLQLTSSSLVLQIADLQHALIMLRHYHDFLAAPPDLPRGSRPVPALRDAVELQDVWFRYADDLPWVLRGVSLRIAKGEAVALVGLNGAGKSTLVKLLCRFYDPTRGRVLWDGDDLRDLRILELRDRIGAVFQDFVTYDLTAAENIGLGDLAHLHDRDRVRAAASLARVDAAIEALPHGYDTLLSREFQAAGENGAHAGTGTLLSGGQWQRLALGRMFMRATRDLLILDEPSSGLDVDAEYAVHRRFREQMTEATSLLISHRFNTVRMADRVVVIDAGRIVEDGSHDALIAAGGEYARMFELQASGYSTASGRGSLE